MKRNGSIADISIARRKKFYKEIVSEFVPDKNASILVCGGGQYDKDVFLELKFKNVTMANLDSRMYEGEYAPFKYSHQNMQDLNFKDNEYDFVITHAAIHHASSPHRALTEMYRVSRLGFIAFESRDSIVMKMLEKLSLTQSYEHTAVCYLNECRFGGVNNTEVPNYIYRWSEREIEKTISSYAPYAKHEFKYRYAHTFPVTPEFEKGARLKVVFLKIVYPFYAIFARMFKKQQNIFAFYVKKPDLQASLYPWLKCEEGKILFNKDWADKKYIAEQK